MNDQEKKPQKVSKLLKRFCPECGIKPELWEKTYYGIQVPKFHVKCPKCGRTTVEHAWAKWVIAAWNKGYIKEQSNRELDIDNDGLVTLMGEVMGQAAKDYQRYASKPLPTYLDKRYIRDLEEFISENPYALPYDSSYILNKLRKTAEETRKKQVS